MNTRQQTREGEANERQEDNANGEERTNLIAVLKDQSEAITAIQQTLALLLAERREGRQTTGSPEATRAEESSTVTPTEGALNATEGPETANDASEGRRGQLFTSNCETGTTTGPQQGPHGRAFFLQYG